MWTSIRSNTYLNQALQVIAFFYQFLAVAVFITALFLANRWLSTPFLGAFYEHTMVFNGVVPTGPDAAWDLRNQGIQLGDQLISVNGQAVHNTIEVQSILSGFQPGDQIPVTVRLLDGSLENLSRHAPCIFVRRPNHILHHSHFTQFIIPHHKSLDIRDTPHRIAGRVFALFASSLSIGVGSLFDLYTTHSLTYIWTLSLAIAGGALLDLALSFPQEASFVAGRSYLRRIGYAISFILCAYAYTTLFNFAHPTDYILAWRYIYIFVGLCSVAYILFNVFYSFAATSPVIKTQARMILTGTIIAFGPLTFWFLTTPLNLFAFTPYLLIPIVIFPLTLGYAIYGFVFFGQTIGFVRESSIFS